MQQRGLGATDLETQRRRLGATDLEISPIGFGAWGIGGDHNAGGHLGAADDRESVAAIHRALELGVNWIDTAPGYGAGHSESVIGAALDGLADPPYVFTKCGFVWDDDRSLEVCLTPESIRMEVEGSLRRLRRDVIDLYQIHWVEPEQDPEIEAAWATLAALRDEGKVRYIGVSNFDVGQLRRAGAIAAVATLQPPYSMLRRDAEADLLPYCDAEGIGVIVYSPLQSGLLTGAMNAARIAALPPQDARLIDDPNFHEPLLSRNLELVDRLRAVAGRSDRTCGELALAWALANPVVTGAIVGFRRPAQVDGVLEGARFTLNADERSDLDAIAAAAARAQSSAGGP